ncbi:Hypothetical predicted protein [Podarcis lilfordi]|uniref:Uncharacterized protein n=1 Tax=Podarcis lilfordi TaxID=74358 RepID=A0AA35NWF3_9SAUR|nr:Hypothetical predicted protein [Podarcis lilfordi]
MQAWGFAVGDDVAASHPLTAQLRKSRLLPNVHHPLLNSMATRAVVPRWGKGKTGRLERHYTCQEVSMVSLKGALRKRLFLVLPVDICGWSSVKDKYLNV